MTGIFLPPSPCIFQVYSFCELSACNTQKCAAKSGGRLDAGVQPCTLSPAVQAVVELMFDADNILNCM
jgi:hypothetical protein